MNLQLGDLIAAGTQRVGINRDRQGPRLDDPAVTAAASGPGHRV